MPDERIVLFGEFKSACNMLSRDQQAMKWRNRVNVLNHDKLIILKQNLCRYITGNYFTEKTRHKRPLGGIHFSFLKYSRNSLFPFGPSMGDSATPTTSSCRLRAK